MQRDEHGFEGPRLSDIAVEQVRLLGTKLRWTLAGLGALSVLVGGGVAWQYPTVPVQFRGALVGPVVILVVLSTIFMATAVWRGEPPSRRDYHWTLPASRAWHAWARIAAGALWLAAVMLAGAIVPLLAGILPPLHLATWAVCVLIVYHLAMIPTLLTEQPDRWMLGVLVLYFGVGIALAMVWAEGWALEAWNSVVAGRFGLARALSPQDLSASAWAPAAAVWLTAALFGVGWAARYRRDG